MNLKTTIGRFRLVAISEGISYLLFAITMPLKYSLGIPEPNKIVGLAHGILFIAYIVMCAQMAYLFKWNLKTVFIAMIASLIPFGTFYADAKIFKPESKRVNS